MWRSLKQVVIYRYAVSEIVSHGSSRIGVASRASTLDTLCCLCHNHRPCHLSARADRPAAIFAAASPRVQSSASNLPGAFAKSSSCLPEGAWNNRYSLPVPSWISRPAPFFCVSQRFNPFCGSIAPVQIPHVANPRWRFREGRGWFGRPGDGAPLAGASCLDALTKLQMRMFRRRSMKEIDSIPDIRRTRASRTWPSVSSDLLCYIL